MKGVWGLMRFSWDIGVEIIPPFYMCEGSSTQNSKKNCLQSGRVTETLYVHLIFNRILCYLINGDRLVQTVTIALLEKKLNEKRQHRVSDILSFHHIYHGWTPLISREDINGWTSEIHHLPWPFWRWNGSRDTEFSLDFDRKIMIKHWIVQFDSST